MEKENNSNILYFPCNNKNHMKFANNGCFSYYINDFSEKSFPSFPSLGDNIEKALSLPKDQENNEI